jgi:alkanesulfonate monooxygenase SsuD/methylene tetrahydromethanopterin reductase-like flavin-dependent oxidoreductase (luciferase family)
VPRIGVVIRPDFAPERIGVLTQLAEDAGIDEVWLWEDCFLQGGIAQAAVALSSTQHVSVGVGVLPAPLRSVVATAMELATLERMFPGRVRVGIGHGVQSWMRQSGVAVASPLTLMGEYVGALRELLSGVSVTCAGRYVRLTDVQLQWVPKQPLPVLIGAAGPKTLQLAGRVADGVVLDCQHTATTARAALDAVHAARAQRPAEPYAAVQYLVCAPGDDWQSRLRSEAANWKVPTADGFGVGGGPDDIRGGVRGYLDAGANSIVLQPIDGEDRMPAFIEAAATALVDIPRSLRSCPP